MLELIARKQVMVILWDSGASPHCNIQGQIPKLQLVTNKTRRLAAKTSERPLNPDSCFLISID